MRTHTYYTHKQACQLLGIDAKTLNAWLQTAGIEMQSDRKDRRIKRITRTQLERLASLHSVTLRDEEILQKEGEEGKALAALALKIERLEQTVETTLPQMQKLIEDALEKQQALVLSIQEQIRKLHENQSGPEKQSDKLT